MAKFLAYIGVFFTKFLRCFKINGEDIERAVKYNIIMIIFEITIILIKFIWIAANDYLIK